MAVNKFEALCNEMTQKVNKASITTMSAEKDIIEKIVRSSEYQSVYR